MKKCLVLLIALSLPYTALADDPVAEPLANIEGAGNVMRLTQEETSDLLETLNSDQGCFPHYEAKLTRIHDRATLRAIGKGAVVAAGIGLCALGPVPALNLLVGTAYEGVAWLYYAFGGIVFTGTAGYGLGSGIAKLLDRGPTLTAVHDLLIASTVSEKSLQDAHFETRVASEVERLNRYKHELGQPPLSEAEIEEIRRKTRYGDRDQTAVDEFIKALNGTSRSYDEVRLAVLQLNKEEALCPVKKNGKRKLLGYKDLVKQVKGTSE